MSAENIIQITVPTTIEVPEELIEGDPEAEIRCEVTLPNSNLSGYVAEVLERGARVFVDENDFFLIIHTSESKAFQNSLEASR